MPPWSRLGLLGVLSLFGCAAGQTGVPKMASDLWVDGADLDRDPKVVDGASAAKDLDVAVRAFDEAYAGLDGHAPTPSAVRVAAERAKLEAKTRWTPLELTNELRDLLRQPDGHLSFGWSGSAPMRVPAWPRASAFLSSANVTRQGTRYLVDGRALVGCDIPHEGSPSGPQGKLEDVIFRAVSGEYRLAVFDPRPESELHCEVIDAEGARTELVVPMREAEGSAGTFAGPAISWEDTARRDSVPVLRIRTFDSAEAGALEKLPAYAETLRKAPAFVVDLRGNGGGNYTFAEHFVAALTDRTLQRLDEREVISIAAAVGRANGARARLARGEVPESAIGVFKEHLARLEHAADSLRDQGGPTRRDRVTQGSTVRGSASGPLRSRAVFLVDGGCASACEMMLSLARQIPGVIIAGQSTRGSMAVGELALFRLPRSGLTITLGTRAFHDPHGDFAETRGYLPDLWISDGSDGSAARPVGDDEALADAVRLAAGPGASQVLARR